MWDLLLNKLLAQATCAVLNDGQIVGTAWLLSHDGYLLTAGHVLCKKLNESESECDGIHDEVQVQFSDDDPRQAHKIELCFQRESGIDFAILKVVDMPTGRHPLPCVLTESVPLNSQLRLRGYGKTLVDPTTGEGVFKNVVERGRSSSNRLFRYESQEVAEQGFSGGAVYSDELHAVVAIQTEVTQLPLGNMSGMALAMPLYRVAEYWKPLQEKINSFEIGLTNPYLSLYAFFGGAEGQQTAHDWGQQLANYLGVPLHPPDDPDIDTTQSICLIYDQADTWVIYASTDLVGNYPLIAWRELSRRMFGATGSAWQDLNQQVFGHNWYARAFLGVTVFFGADMASLPFYLKPNSWLEEIPLLPKSKPLEPILSSQQPWGMLWQLAGPSDNSFDSPHIYAVLSTPEQNLQANAIILTLYRIDQVELSLHRVYQQLRQYKVVQNQLYSYISGLDTTLAELLENPLSQQNNFTAFLKRYVEFTRWRGEIALLQRSVTTNTINYHQSANKLNLFRQEDDIFQTYQQLLRDGKNKLETDLIAYDAAIQRLNAGIQALQFNFILKLVELMTPNPPKSGVS